MLAKRFLAASAPNDARAESTGGDPRAPAGISPGTSGSSLTEALSGLGEVTPLGGGNRVAEERVLQSGVSLTPSKTRPYWACPKGACEAIIDPPAHKIAGRWTLPDGLHALEGSGEKGGYDPQDLQSAYSIPTTGGEAQQHYEEKQTIAVVDVGDHAEAESDLAEYRKKYGLPSCTNATGCFRRVNEQGEERNFPPASGEWELETSLDLDMASAACPHCHVLLAESSRESLTALAETANSAAKLGASEISNSYGFPENEELGEGTEQRACGENHCQQLDADYNHPGVVVTAGAGDAGYDNYLRGGTAPLFPAVSSNVIAVGGTSLHKTTEGRKWSEAVWWEPEDSLGTGSGCSSVRVKPIWQSDSGCTHRTDNDMAAVAACETPVSIYSSYLGGWENVCGTSVSSPLVAGIEAHANEAGGAVPSADAFYQKRSTLYDVTKGRNDTSCSPEYLCSAETQEQGYDGPAGNGTPAAGPVVASGEPPSARSDPPSAGDTLNGTVDPNGLATTYCFEYGTSTSYGTCVPAGEASAGTGTTAVKVSQALTGLAPGIYHYRLAAKNADGTGHGEDQLLDTAPPTVTGIAPTSGWNIGGTQVKITGSNFVGVSAVRFGSAVATGLKVLSETEIEAASPPGSGTVDVTVENAGGSSATSQADRFTYNVLPPPTVTAIGPDVGRTIGHTWVTISGTYFAGVSAVKFGSTEARRFEVLSETEIVALSPAGTGAVDVTVTTPPATSATGAADRFSYEIVEPPSGATPGWLAPAGLEEGFETPEPTAAMDEHGDAATLWYQQGTPHAAFRPAGGSWEAPVKLSPGFPRAEEQLAFDQKGDLFALWGAEAETGNTQTAQAAIRPVGGSWEPYTTLSPACPNMARNLEPKLAVDSTGDALAGWHCYVTEGGSERELLQTAFRPAGGAWQAPAKLAEVIPQSGAALFSPQIVFDSHGNAYAGWYYKGASEVAYRPAGGSWQVPTSIPEAESEPELAVDGHGDLYARVRRWGGYAVAYLPSGGSWQAPVQVVSQNREGGAQPEAARLAVDARGDALLTWVATESGRVAVEAAWKPAGGRWQATVIVSESVVDQGRRVQVTLDAEGDAIAAWRGYGSSERTVLETARRPAGGGWHSPVQLTERATGEFEPQLASSPQGNAVIVWNPSQAAGYDAGPQLESLTIASSGTVGQAASFSVSPLGVWSSLKETKWTFGDGSSASGTSASHTYTTSGSYKVTVESEDALGQKSTATRTIDIAPAYSMSIEPSAPAHPPSALAANSEGDVWVSSWETDSVKEFKENGEPLRSIGPLESPCSGQLEGPYGLAVDPAGNLWVADMLDGRIREFSPEGKCLKQFGSAGSGPGQFKQPHGVALDSHGNLWISDTGNQRIQELSSEGAFERQLGPEVGSGGELAGPGGLAIDSHGHVWVTDIGHARVIELGEAGEYLGQVGQTSTMGCDPLMCLPMGVAVDSAGNLLVADYGHSRVDQFSESGQLLNEVGSFGSGEGQFEWPLGIAVDPKTNLWVSDWGNGRVERWVGG